MLRGRRAGFLAACAIAAAAGVLAGCGGGSQAAAQDPVAAAATKTQHAGAARIRYTLAITAPRLPGGTVRINGNGVIDGTSGLVDFDLGSALQAAGVPAGSSIREIYLKQGADYVVYVKLGALASRIPGGKQWLELDLSKLGSSAGIDLNQLLSGSRLQPADVLSTLETEGASVRKVGSEKVDGTPTTHYRVTVDLAKALEAKGLTSPLLAGTAAELPSIPEDVWIGGDGLVRRIKLSYGLQHQGRSMRMALSMDIYDYGVDVTIAAPPSNQVFDATQLAQQRLGSAFGN
ncbi:MAG TPA: hypothetical protein VFL58_00975 [Gaiellaceae bacterium]|nr:hypothetical protein [Gaiellaceae bacterium]